MYLTIQTRGRSETSTKVFVGSLPAEATTDDLRKLFEPYGTISECDIANRCGFLHLEDEELAIKAIEELNGADFMGAKISVEKGRIKSNRRGGGRGGGPMRGGRGGDRGGPYSRGGDFRGGPRGFGGRDRDGGGFRGDRFGGGGYDRRGGPGGFDDRRGGPGGYDDRRSGGFPQSDRFGGGGGGYGGEDFVQYL